MGDHQIFCSATSGGGIPHDTLLLYQCRSIWLPRPTVGLICCLGGAFLGNIAEDAGLLVAQAPDAAASSEVAAAGAAAGACGAWLLCWVLLCMIKRLEDISYGFSDDECADRSAAPLLLGLPAVATAAAAGWVISRCFAR